VSEGCTDKRSRRVQESRCREGAGGGSGQGVTKIQESEFRRVQGSGFQEGAGIKVAGGRRDQSVRRVHG
jgi:hypothetical protein